MNLSKFSREFFSSPNILCNLTGKPDASINIKITIIKIKRPLVSTFPRLFNPPATSFMAAFVSKSFVSARPAVSIL